MQICQMLWKNQLYMSSTFLSRFSGRTQTISKLGVEGVLRGPQTESTIYTNTTQHHLSSQRIFKSEPKRPPLSEQEQRPTLHLPPLQARLDTSKQEQQDVEPLVKLKKSRGKMVKETNWMIEDEPEPEEPAANRNVLTSSINQPETHINRSLKKHLKSYKHESMLRLGGLGPNLGK